MNRLEQLEQRALKGAMPRHLARELESLRAEHTAKHVQTMSTEMRMPETAPEMESLFDARPFDSDPGCDSIK